MAAFQRILVPVDGSESAHRAFTTAVELARRGGARLRLVHVLDELLSASGWRFATEVMESNRQQARAVLERWAGTCARIGIACDTQVLEPSGHRLGEAVAEEAGRWHADLVVVGSHGRRGVGRALLGSGAEQIARLAPVPVLVVRHPVAHAPDRHQGT
ncbi:universal stress protein [Ramlibacter algicola]|uniref:Universal stress protein n=1 Tax=Ramlibacter algicola TaxID=2795217 RepID=A0A934UR61_9BURK|nr:universal stress protein [Ramlibacter algicola]MBK0392531.1 universal stress protein [Ramlibacter algicola]